MLMNAYKHTLLLNNLDSLSDQLLSVVELFMISHDPFMTFQWRLCSNTDTDQKHPSTMTPDL